MSDGPVAALIREKLTAGLSPVALELVDDSWKHASHHHEGGIDAQDGGETHFQLRIVSEQFAGQNRVQRHRTVNSLLKDELAGSVHALSIIALTPGEADAT